MKMCCFLESLTTASRMRLYTWNRGRLYVWLEAEMKRYLPLLRYLSAATFLSILATLPSSRLRRKPTALSLQTWIAP